MIITLDDVRAILPAFALMIGAFAAVAVGTVASKERRQGLAELVSYFALAFSLAVIFLRLFYRPNPAVPIAIDGFNHAIRLDELALFLSMAIVVATGLTIVLSADYAKGREIPHGEYYGLILLAASGMLVLVQSLDLITFFIALEVLSLALYALSGLFRRDARSNEASIKYFVMGAFASGFLLYGMALLYGATGEISIDRIGVRIAQGLDPDLEGLQGLVTLGFTLMAIGLAFKVGAVPFHQWVPDVYEGAPTSVTAFMSVSVKAAGFGAVLRLLMTAAEPESATWGAILWALALATMVVGNLLALWQQSVKRMLAYSSIAHTGYILVAVASMRSGGPEANQAGAAAVFYLFVYTFMTLGAFAFLIFAGREGREAEMFDDFAGLAKRRPWAALAMTIFMVSLAGIPPTAGFFGKFMLFKAAVAAEEYTLVIVGVLTSAVSLYYYLRVVVMMYMHPEPGEAPAGKPAFNVGLVVFLTVVFTLALGILPSKYWHLSQESIRSLQGTRPEHR